MNDNVTWSVIQHVGLRFRGCCSKQVLNTGRTVHTDTLMLHLELHRVGSPNSQDYIVPLSPVWWRLAMQINLDLQYVQRFSDMRFNLNTVWK